MNIPTPSDSTAERPSFAVVPGPTVAELEAGLRRWAELRPHLLRVEVVGQSAGGRPMLLGRVTDDRVPDDDKQTALVTTCHGGMERNTVSSVLHLIRWLLSDDADAIEVRRRQIVLAMPCCEPDGYDSRLPATDPSWNRGVPYAWTWDRVVEPEKYPEAVAIKSVMDRYQPDVHVDVHGVWYEQQMMWESTGWGAGGSNLDGSYWHQIPELMNEAAEAAGFLINRAAQSSGQVFATTPVPDARAWYFGADVRNPIQVLDTVHSYFNYHAIAFVMEVGFDQSAVARLRRLLQIGNEVWHGESLPGYPTHQLSAQGPQAIASWGRTASERRASRVELWRKLPQLTYSLGWPEPRDSILAVVATTPSGRARCDSSLTEQQIEAMLANVREDYQTKPAWLKESTTIEELFARLGQDPQFDARGLAEYQSLSPAEYVRFLRYDPPSDVRPVQNGLAIRLFVPYPDPALRHLKLDGHDLTESDTDGYTLYHNPGTIIQVNIPPGRVRDLHVVSCVFDPNVDRPSGFRPSDWVLS